MAGQSNMSGRGDIAQLPSFTWSNSVLNYATDGKLKEPVEPIDSNVGEVYSILGDPGATASPMLSFANALASLRPSSQIVLVPCPKGATRMTDWARSISTATCYGAMVARANAAKALGGTIKGLCWYQGESDADNSSDASQWSERFNQLVTDVRSDLGASVKVVFTILGPDSQPGDFPFWTSVVSEQTHYSLPIGVARVTAQDLSTPVGNVHLTTASLVTLGQRMANAMNGLL